jgi:hypothetical protein
MNDRIQYRWWKNCCIIAPLWTPEFPPFITILTFNTPLRVGSTRLPQRARFFILERKDKII